MHFFSGGSGVFKSENVTIHRAQFIMQWFEKHDNDVILYAMVLSITKVLDTVF